MRRAFSDTLMKIASENPRLIFLTGDLGFQVFDNFRERFGPRYVNVGVAEAEMIDAAAGLAFEGWRPIAYSIASFATGRAYEQIRVSVCYPHLPVIVVGAGGGYTYSNSGVTHHAADDLGLMSLLPGMTVVAPGDPNEVSQLFPQLFNIPGPSYIRIGKFGEKPYTVDEPAILGRARLLADGEQIAIVSVGDMAVQVLEALETLRTESITPLCYQMHTVKPLDTNMLELLTNKVKTIILAEEHFPNGGLYAGISAWLANRGEHPKLLRLGPSDALALGNLEREELRRRMNYDRDAIIKTCREAWYSTQSNHR
jgi:transketolase